MTSIRTIRWALFFGALIAAVFQLFGGSAEASGVAMAVGAIALSDDQIKELQELLVSMKGGWEKVRNLPEEIKKLQALETRLKSCEDENSTLRETVRAVQRANMQARAERQPHQLTWRGWNVGDPQPNVSKACAKYLAAISILGAAGHKIEVKEPMFNWAKKHVIDELDLCKDEPEFKSFGSGDKVTSLESYQKQVRSLTFEQRAALTTSDIPMPIVYSSEVVELVSVFGTFRRFATVIPLPGGTFRLPKLTTSPAFGFIDMSGSVGEKSPQISFVDFDPKKAGGIIRIPTEIDEDSVVTMGQFIARYIAREMASWEDETGWKADGSGTYKTLEGVVDRIVDNSGHVTLGSGLTGSDDVTLASLRQARGKVHESIINRGMGAYYLNATMESVLVSFNTDTNGEVFQINTTRGVPTLDGWPVFWVNKFPVYSTSAIVSTIVAAFGDMSFWYLGLRGALRIDTSKEAFFATDEIGVRALERFTVKEMATNHMGGVRTAAS